MAWLPRSLFGCVGWRVVQNFLGRLLPGVTRARGALFVLSKGVWTVSTLTSALRNVYVPDSHTLHLDV